MNCPCGSTQSFENCCAPYIRGERLAPTAEALMRSRYTAYTRADMAYIKKTLAPEAQKGFDPAASKQWAVTSEWKSLKIVSTDKGQPEDKKGTVEFIAVFKSEGETLEHHEVSTFRKTDRGEWLFIDGEAHTHKEGEGHHHHHPKIQTVVRDAPKIGRNDPCTCGSGKKYKKCCGAAA